MNDPKNKQNQDSASADTEDTSTETFTKDQVDKLLRDTRNAALADVGRIKKEAELHASTAKAALERVERLVKEQEQLELDVAGDDSDALSRIRTRQTLRAKETELASAKEELNLTRQKLTEKEVKEAELTKEKTAHQIASDRGVDAELLADLARFTDGSTEAIEGLAKKLPKKDNDKKKIELNPDSNRSSGGGGKGKRPSLEELKAVSPAEFEAKIAAGEWAI